MTISRRRFLQLSSLAGASFLVPEFLSSCVSQVGSNKKLVVIQLSGGNDGLNTIVPYRNDIYYRSRPHVSLAQNEILKLTGEAGLHPSLKNLKRIYEKGYVSIINSVGYPEPSRSHFRSMDIWHSGHTSGATGTGWLGRYMDCSCRAAGKATGMCVEMDETISLALRGSRKEGQNKAGLVSDTNGRGGDYPDTQIGNSLKLVAQGINGGSGTKAYYLSHGSFDTHVNQKEHHAHLLEELDEALGAFVSDLDQQRQMEDVMVFMFSEFGRRVAENPLKGTDHGAANNVVLISGALKKAGMYNGLPDLAELDEGDIKHSIDFRQIYATVLERWLDADPQEVLGGTYEQLSMI
jgi:uncharacterized protein (DUF1501 family)